MFRTPIRSFFLSPFRAHIWQNLLSSISRWYMWVYVQISSLNLSLKNKVKKSMGFFSWLRPFLRPSSTLKSSSLVGIWWFVSSLYPVHIISGQAWEILPFAACSEILDSIYSEPMSFSDEELTVSSIWWIFTFLFIESSKGFFL